jgi:hypothetical protein
LKNAGFVFYNLPANSEFVLQVFKLKAAGFYMVFKNLHQVHATEFIPEFPFEELFQHAGIRSVTKHRRMQITEWRIALGIAVEILFVPMI